MLEEIGGSVKLMMRVSHHLHFPNNNSIGHLGERCGGHIGRFFVLFKMFNDVSKHVANEPL